MASVRTLTALFELGAGRAPTSCAIVDGPEVLDWTALRGRVDAAAARLAGAGIGDGDAVALWLPNSIDYLALVFACAKLGALAVHINTRFGPSEVGDLLHRSRAKVLVTQWAFPPVDFPAVLSAIPQANLTALKAVIGRHLPVQTGPLGTLPVLPLEGASGSFSDQARPDALALTFTTSGTTSGPKLVAHDQQSVAGHAVEVMHRLGLGHQSAVLLAAVPFCGTYGLTAVLAAMAGGACVVCMDRFDPAVAAGLIRKHAVTHAIGGDDMLAKLMDAAGPEAFTSLKWFGFAAFSAGAAATALSAIPMGLEPFGIYGSSELQAFFAIGHGEGRLRSGGRLTSRRAEVSVRDPDTGAVLEPGQSGELWFKGPSRFAGYVGDDAATARAITDEGWFRSGDLGYLEGDGFVFEARLGDTLRLGGFMVSPEEIEGFLAGLPGVCGAQVVGLEQSGGMKPIAFVTALPGATLDPAGLIAACLGKIARYKVPSLIHVIDEFPTTDGPNGRKIQRARLRQMAVALASPEKRSA